MKKVIIVGAGGHAAELNDYIYHDNTYKNSTNKLEVVGFIDDDKVNYNNYSFSAPFLGDIFSHEVKEDVFYLMGIANLKFRKKIVFDLIQKGAQFTSFIHPDAFISPSSRIGIGAVIAPNVNLGPNTDIGMFTMVNSRCSIGHDSKVGDFNFLSPNVCFSGNTEVGKENLFGINSATIPGIKVGNGNKIMAGMVLDRNVGENEVVFFRFKEKLIAISK
ncbi:acetyltransferase [Belliella sp. R4-6]|uniref:Acetyltransferase n=1 Tax=Belliella alkalica TaxID=1730871 RepID=A0ABS9V6K5_9BACT|nr:acetyltransferase [Belliella alkalica]MCH7412052.1 acetyltransferase [Belliella alkalica]